MRDIIKQDGKSAYHELDFGNADEMLRKAQIATKIIQLISQNGWTQQKAAHIIGLPQPKVSDLMRGQFRGISESKMLTCLTKLGMDIKIVLSYPQANNAMPPISTHRPQSEQRAVAGA